MSTMQSQILSILEKLLSDPPLTNTQTDKILCIVEKMADFPLAAIDDSVVAIDDKIAKPETNWTVHLISDGGQKIKCIKAIRALTDMPLKEAKKLSESLPRMINQYMTSNEALKWLDVFQEAGSEVEITQQ